MIGIIGAGNMGRAIALRIKAKTIISDVDIYHYDKSDLDKLLNDINIEFFDLPIRK